MSMKPGVTAQPLASSSRAPRKPVPISRIRPSAIATSATHPGPPFPSYTVPPRMTRSVGMRAPSVVHELEQVAVGIARVDAGSGALPAAGALDRAFLDFGPGPDQAIAQLLGGALPHEAQVAARWGRGRRPQGEAVALPGLGPVKVDHLVADVHRHDVRVLRDLASERAVERDHRVRVAHRQRHVVETGDLTHAAA